jgi:hypothetical protein
MLCKPIVNIAVSLRSSRMTFRAWPLLQAPDVFVQLDNRLESLVHPSPHIVEGAA